MEQHEGAIGAEEAEQIVEAALEERRLILGGGEPRVGIGDTPAAFPDRSNAEVVQMAVRWVEGSGRSVASPGDVRARLGLPPVETSRG